MSYFDVIIPTYNGERYIEDALNSVLSQTYKKFHITVVDDCSSDSTLDKVLGVSRKNPGRITILKPKNKLRAAGCRMYAVAKTSADFISFLDQDDRWSPQMLQRKIEKFADCIDILHTNSVSINSEGLLRLKASDEENFFRNNLYSNGFKSLAGINLLRSLNERNHIRITSSSIRRRSFLAYGGFDVDLFGGEEWEFWLRAAANDAVFGLIPCDLLEKRSHECNTSSSFRDERNEGLLNAADVFSLKFPQYADLMKRRRAQIYRSMIMRQVRLKNMETARQFWRRWAESNMVCTAYEFFGLWLICHSRFFAYTLVYLFGKK